MSTQKNTVLWILSAIALVFLWAPLLVIVVVSFDVANYLSFPPRGFTLENYAAVFQDREFVTGFVLSLVIGIVVSLLATALGVLAAMGVRRLSPRLSGTLSAFLLSPLFLPHVVLGLAIMLVFAKASLLNTTAGIVVAHLVLTLPYAFRTVLASLQTYDASSEDAARVLGATRLTVFRRVTLPLIRPGLASALLLGFLISFDESVVVLFIAGRGSETLPIALLHRVEVGADPVVAALSVVLILISAAAVFAVNRVFDLRKAVSA